MPPVLGDEWMLLGAAAAASVAVASRPALGVTFSSPIPGGTIVSGWGRPRPSRGGIHRGIDIPAPPGSPVFAAAPGRVIRADFTDDSNAGLHVAVALETPRGRVVHRYLHLSRPLVGVGRRIRRGQLVGLSGATGVEISDPHLHFDIHVSPRLAEAYLREHGQPDPRLPAPGPFGVAVPAEPLVSGVDYSDRTVAEAGRRGVPLRAV